ncbi:hypothetical protein GCM10009122_59880 [Fulvivirga kasyanovii]
MSGLKLALFLLTILWSATSYGQATIDSTLSEPDNGSIDVAVNLDTAEIMFTESIYSVSDSAFITGADLKDLVSISHKNLDGITHTLNIESDYTLGIDDNSSIITITFKPNGKPYKLEPENDYIVKIAPVKALDGTVSDTLHYTFTTAPYATINALTTEICKGTYTTLNDIEIYEGGKANFQYVPDIGNLQLLTLVLPDGFEFEKGQGTVRKGENSDISFHSQGLFYEHDSLSHDPRKVHIIFKNPENLPQEHIDILTISGLKVKISDGIPPDPLDQYSITMDKSSSALLLGIKKGDNGTPFASIKITDLPQLGVVYKNNTTQETGNSINICTSHELEITAEPNYNSYTFIIDGSPVSNDNNVFMTTSISEKGEHSFKVTARSQGGCELQSATTSLYFGTTPKIKITDIINGDVTNNIKDGDEYAMPNDDPQKMLQADPESEWGNFLGHGVESSKINDKLTYFFNPANPNIDNRAGRYSLIYVDNNNECFSGIEFHINLFKSNSEQILGLQNSGVCIDSDAEKILIGWVGQGTVGELIGETNAINISSNSRGMSTQALQGTLNPAYDKGLLSGFYLDPSKLKDEKFKAGDTLTFEINYTPKGESDVTKVLTQDVIIAQTPKLVTSLMGGDSIKATYCQNSSPIELLGNPLGGLGTSKIFSILNLDTATNISSAVPLEDMNLHFDSKNVSGATPQNFLAPNNKGYVITFEYISEYGCRAVRNDTVRVLPLPDSIFTDTRTFNYCIGDDIGKLFVAEVDSLDIADSLEYLWYDERENLLQAQTYSFNTGISNQFPSTTSYFVSQRLVDYGCVGPLSELEVNVGENPVAEFSFAESCATGTLSFIDESQGGIVPKDTVNQWLWSFNDPGSADSSAQTNPFYAFSEPGIYDVKLKVLTSVGCSDSIVHSVATYTYPPIDFSKKIYFEGFEQGAAGWISTTETEQANGLANNSSWRLTIPEGDLINETQTGNHTWVTSNTATAAYNDNEDSWVESPCFNLNLWDRPKVEMDIWYNTEKFEGATLQYAIKGETLSAANTKWETVGSIGSGIEWFNSTGISAAPGGQALGWEGSVSGWKSAKISLDGVKEKAAGQPVRFRIAFASLDLGDNRENKFDGFAFDNFAIRERNRMVVLEHFTNVNAANNEKENTYIDNFAAARPAEVIKIEYHTDFPGLDPVNKLNTADPSAHALEYGISEVPRTVMDGTYGVYHRNDPFSTDSWGEDVYTKRANIDAPFNLTISDNIITGGENTDNPGGSLKIEVTLTKNPTADTISSPLVLEIGILQKSLEANGRTYHNVLRKLLPNAAGNYIYGDWLPNDISRTETVTQYWSPDFMYDPADTFLIVAYVHDTHLSKTRTKEIYQGAYKQINILPPTASVTGLNNGTNQSFKIYPNPSKGDAVLVFDQPLIEDSPINVYSSTGLQIYEGNITKGATSFKIPLESCPEGLYIVSFYAQGRIIRLPHILR